jgi:hypothetical protein
MWSMLKRGNKMQVLVEYHSVSMATGQTLGSHVPLNNFEQWKLRLNRSHKNHELILIGFRLRGQHEVATHRHTLPYNYNIHRTAKDSFAKS